MDGDSKRKMDALRKEYKSIKAKGEEMSAEDKARAKKLKRRISRLKEEAANATLETASEYTLASSNRTSRSSMGTDRGSESTARSASTSRERQRAERRQSRQDLGLGGGRSGRSDGGARRPVSKKSDKNRHPSGISIEMVDNGSGSIFPKPIPEHGGANPPRGVKGGKRVELDEGASTKHKLILGGTAALLLIIIVAIAASMSGGGGSGGGGGDAGDGTGSGSAPGTLSYVSMTFTVDAAPSPSDVSAIRTRVATEVGVATSQVSITSTDVKTWELMVVISDLTAAEAGVAVGRLDTVQKLQTLLVDAGVTSTVGGITSAPASTEGDAPSITPSISESTSSSASISKSASSSASISKSASTSASTSASASSSASTSASASSTPSTSESASSSPSISESASSSPSVTVSPSLSGTPTSSLSFGASPSASDSASPSASTSSSASSSASSSSSTSNSATPSRSASNSASTSSSASPSASSSNSEPTDPVPADPTPTATPTPTAIPTPTPTPTPDPPVDTIVATLRLGGLTADEFDDTAQDDFKSSLANSLPGVDPTWIVITGVDEVALTKSWGLDIKFVILVPADTASTADQTGTSDPSDDGGSSAPDLSALAETVMATMENATAFIQTLTTNIAASNSSIAAAVPDAEAFTPPTVSTCRGTAAPLIAVPSTTSGGAYRLPISTPGKLIILSVTNGQTSWGAWFGRSYEGHYWETTANSPISFDCCSSWCTVALPFMGSQTTTTDGVTTVLSSEAWWKIEEVENAQGLAVPHGSKESMSRFLIQTTFGPTMDAIDQLHQSMNASITDAAEREKLAMRAWVHDQMALEPTLHRAYYRRRTNIRMAQGTVMPTGVSQGPCQPGSRFQRYTFGDIDVTKTIVVTHGAVDGTYELRLDGELRTVVNSTSTSLTNTSYYVSSMNEWVGGNLNLKEGSSAGASVTVPNPAIHFNTLDPWTTQDFGTDEATFVDLDPYWTVGDVVLLQSMDVACQDPPPKYVRYQGTFYGFDSRLTLMDNTLDNPVNVSFAETAVETCPTVPETFLNRDSCIKAASCAPTVYGSVMLQLNETTLRTMWEVSGKPVYSIVDLRLENPYHHDPCGQSTSRWRRGDAAGCVESTLEAATRETIVRVINATSDANPLVIDIDLAADGGTCSSSGGATLGASVLHDGVCYTHVHPDLYSVYDASYWNEDHPGNSGNFRPIVRFAEQGGVELHFPSHHTMSRWRDNKGKFYYLGRMGDMVDFKDLPPEVQDTDLAQHFGANGALSSEGFVVCGSPGEVSNTPDLGSHYSMKLTYVSHGNKGLYNGITPTFTKIAVWFNVVFKAADQLRQRVAWALSQILVISVEGVEVKNGHQEIWFGYMDIFVRHAFGNYRDILREVAYSPMMATMLTFLNSRSFSVGGSRPDENFAREFMQLFTIGLYELNDDGTHKRDASGNSIETYGTDNILEFARAWTGFQIQAFRGNIEGHRGTGSTNYQDPLLLNSYNRDMLPKAGLRDAYIGDGYPLCGDFPARSYLRQGSRFRSLGSSEHAKLVPSVTLPSWFQYSDTGGKKVMLDAAGSSLYQALCDPSPHDGTCQFPLRVTLASKLPCYGIECELDQVVVVGLVDGNVTTYYEHVREPCVYMAFYPNAKKTHRSRSSTQCADPEMPAAGTNCCDMTRGNWYLAYETCNYLYEDVPFATAKARCPAVFNSNHVVCSAGHLQSRDNGACGYWWRYQWLDEPCQLQVQIDSYGKAAIVHVADTTPLPSDISIGRTEAKFRADSGNWFKVHWESRSSYMGALGGLGYPAVGAGCGPDCEVHGDTCLCNVTTGVSTAFTDPSYVPTAAEVTDQLRIGSPPIDLDEGEYVQCFTLACNSSANVDVFIRANSSAFDTTTVFKISGWKGDEYRLNKRMVVYAGGYTFRSPPTFHHFTHPAFRDAEEETEAVISHLFYHSNTAPFISQLLIQRLGSSNPSPRYVEAVVQAFRSGTHDGVTYSGKYGDLAATIAAIILDREARSTILDADPTSGQLREPVIKTIHLMRAMEYEVDQGIEIAMERATSFGQQIYNAPSVFNYYLPDHEPPGPIRTANLKSPEMMISTTPYLINWINGMYTLVQDGMTRCHGGWAKYCVLNHPEGVLSFSPESNATDDVLSDLNMLFTGGRMTNESLAVIRNAYEAWLSTDDETCVDTVGWTEWTWVTAGGGGCQWYVDTNRCRDGAVLGARQGSVFRYPEINCCACGKDPGPTNTEAIKMAQMLFITSAEFHATNINVRGAERPPPMVIHSLGRRYKAIVVLFLWGGADSYNMIVPYSHCNASMTDVDLYSEYSELRGGTSQAALSQGVLGTIGVAPGQQPCNTFGVHPSLSNIKSMYEAGDALFVANTGPLVEPITLEEYTAKSKRIPQSLYAHNVQQSLTQTVHAGTTEKPKGVLGRIIDACRAQQDPYKSMAYSLAGVNDAMKGDHAPQILSYDGVKRLDDGGIPGLFDHIHAMSSVQSSSIFSETYNYLLNHSVTDTEHLGTVLSETGSPSTSFPNTRLGNQFKQVAQIIKARSVLGNEREVFFVQDTGYDFHFTFDLSSRFSQVDAAVAAFKTEMQAQGLWDQVVLVSSSDFGRSLEPNNGGTDHAWGGNYFVTGGEIRGGQILGQYPSRLRLPESDLNIGNGRIIPTTSWESVWNPIVRWFGVEHSRVPDVLPNIVNFDDSDILTESEMFHEYIPTPTPTPFVGGWVDLTGKVSAQSSTYHSNGAARANDGNTNANMGEGSCTHTSDDAVAWWNVDLGVSASILEVRITNRGDCCGGRLSGFDVLVDDTACATNVPLTDFSSNVGVVPCVATGQVVQVQITNGFLQLCEVEVLVANISAV